MGWTGGGLGKGGQGISEPIRAADFNNRQGTSAFNLTFSQFSNVIISCVITEMVSNSTMVNLTKERMAPLHPHQMTAMMVWIPWMVKT